MRCAAANLLPQQRADVARGVEDAIVDTLIAKALRALEQTGLEVLVVSGGVSANRALRTRLSEAVGARGARVYYPRIEFCTDNAAMIAVAGTGAPGGRRSTTRWRYRRAPSGRWSPCR